MVSKLQEHFEMWIWHPQMVCWSTRTKIDFLTPLLEFYRNKKKKKIFRTKTGWIEDKTDILFTDFDPLSKIVKSIRIRIK